VRGILRYEDNIRAWLRRPVRIVIDGYNLIRQSPTLSRIERQDLEAGRAELVRRLAAYRKRKGHQILVVFDGTRGRGSGPGAERVQGVSVSFSRPGETADQVIKRLAVSGGNGLVVVTSDRELARFAERQGATAIGAEDFERRLCAPALPSFERESEEEEGACPRPKKGTPRRPPRALRRREFRLSRL
jgi:predicted RNA-binding protein with PIN domain